METTSIKVSSSDAKKLVVALENTPKPSKRLKQAGDNYLAKRQIATKL